MAWDNQYIDPDAQKIFDEKDEREQGKMVNDTICKLKEKIGSLESENEELKDRNKELEKTFDAILKAPAIKKHIKEKIDKQRHDDAESERRARAYEKEDKWMMEHGGW